MGIIVNGDDFGKSDEINQAIDLAFERGLIDRTTLMVNMPAAKAAMQLAREKGYAEKVGIHLNLTEGRPLTKELAKDPLLCDANGYFTGDIARKTRLRFFLPAKTASRIQEEIRAQLEEYKRLGGTLWHLDSHHYVHSNFSVWRNLKGILVDYPLSSIRLSRNLYRRENPFKSFYKLLLNCSIRKFCDKKSDLFGSRQDFELYTKGMQEEEIARLTASKNIEIMVHPIFDEQGELFCR